MSARHPWRLWLYGLGMVVPLAYFAARYPLLIYSHQLTDIGFISGYRPAEFIGFTGGVALLFGLYILALRESQHLRAAEALPVVFICGVVLAVIIACMYPVGAIDLFLYAVRSRLWTTYGVNPIAAYPRDYPTDLWTPYISPEWAAHVSPYGPLWNIVAAPITYLAGDNITAALFGFKLLAIACLLTGGWAIMRTLTITRSASPATGALFYLWNPLVLWEGIGNGHNDVVMALAILLALLAWSKHHDHLVIPCLVMATLIKYVSLVFLPIAIVMLWRRNPRRDQRWRIAWVSITLSAIVALIALYPFYDITAIRTSIQSQSSFISVSPVALIMGLLQSGIPAAQLKQLLQLASAGLVLATIAWWAAALWKDSTKFPRATFEILYLFLLVAMWSFRGWYLVWLVAVAAMIPRGWVAARTIIWTATSLVSLGLFIWIEAWWQPGWPTIQNIGVAFIFGGTCLLTLIQLNTYLGERKHKPTGAGVIGRADEGSVVEH